MRTRSRLWLGIIILVLASPLGLVIPAYFKSGPAWGEWSKGNFWQAPFPDYAFKGVQEKGLVYASFAYIASALVGILAVIAVFYLLAKFLAKNEK